MLTCSNDSTLHMVARGHVEQGGDVEDFRALSDQAYVTHRGAVCRLDKNTVKYDSSLGTCLA